MGFTTVNQITLKNFRCFRNEEGIRLAPLTLLVGENSTGKTSFLAMIRALWDVAYIKRDPDFKEDPYDLGSFSDIVHYRGSRDPLPIPTTFEAGLDIVPQFVTENNEQPKNLPRFNFKVVFEKRGAVSNLSQMRLSSGDVWGEYMSNKDGHWQARFGTKQGTWNANHRLIGKASSNDDAIWNFNYWLFSGPNTKEHISTEPIDPQGANSPDSSDWEKITKLFSNFSTLTHSPFHERAYASAPVRSKPHRTYDPARTIRDPEGDHIPMYLADMYLQDKGQWVALKKALEEFGQNSGLFDDITINYLGEHEGGPFQVYIRKHHLRKYEGNKKGIIKGPHRNLIDVGYGVSQALPIIMELLRPDASPIFLFQQPEVHLHPSAQAALGSLFCEIASTKRQLIIETHSDHLINRVRMDIRDRKKIQFTKTQLKPEDVSILFFERGDLDVKIHSLRIDDDGNILNAPQNYRSFFLEETKRSLGL